MDGLLRHTFVNKEIDKFQSGETWAKVDKIYAAVMSDQLFFVLEYKNTPNYTQVMFKACK